MTDLPLPPMYPAGGGASPEVLESLAEQLKSDRLKDGLCPNCGTRLYKVVKPGLFVKNRKSQPPKMKYKPLTIEGEVTRGQCLRCTNTGGDDGDFVPGLTLAGPPMAPAQPVAQPVVLAEITQGREGAEVATTDQGDVVATGLEPFGGTGGFVANFDEHFRGNGASTQPPASSMAPMSSTADEEEFPDPDFASADDSSEVASTVTRDTFASLAPPSMASTALAPPSMAVSSITDDCRWKDVTEPRSVRSGAGGGGNGPASVAMSSLTGVDTYKEDGINHAQEGEDDDTVANQTTTSAGMLSTRMRNELSIDGRSNARSQARGREDAKTAPSSTDALARRMVAELNKAEDAASDAISQIRPAGGDDGALNKAKEEEKAARAGANGDSGNVPSRIPAPPTRPGAVRVHGPPAEHASSQSGSGPDCPPGMDPTVFHALPPELQREALVSHRTSMSSSPPVRSSSSDASSEFNRQEASALEAAQLVSTAGLDPEALAALPEDMRHDIFAQEQASRTTGRGSVSAGASKNVTRVGTAAKVDAETFAALPEDIQKEIAAQEAAGAIMETQQQALDAVATLAVPDVDDQRANLGGVDCTYRGSYNVHGERHGQGELNWANGDKYVGTFYNGDIDGEGTLTFADGTEYVGHWRRNRFNGDGTRRFANGNVYTGKYRDGKRFGHGRCYFANGDMYVGEWKKDQIDGFGRYYYNNGHSFEGMFRRGKRNGRGKYQLSDGRVEIYKYVEDFRAGEGVRWSADRKKAWRMVDGKVKNKVSLDEAAAIANNCGRIVETDTEESPPYAFA